MWQYTASSLQLFLREYVIVSRSIAESVWSMFLGLLDQDPGPFTFKKIGRKPRFLLDFFQQFNGENSRIRIQIHYSEARIRGSIRIRTKISRIRNTGLPQKFLNTIDL